MSLVIDVHSHLYPPEYIDLLRTRRRRPRVCTVAGEDRFILFPDEDQPGRPAGRPMDESFWSIDAKLAFMDGAGIDRSVVSVGNPWLDPFSGRATLAYAEDLNEAMAGLEARSGGRLVGLGVLPNAEVVDAAATVRVLADDGRLRGCITGTRICGLALDHPGLALLWGALAETGLPWMLHPSDGVAVDALGGYAHTLPIALGFPFETTVGLARLVLAGVLVRHRGIRLLVAHGGGAMPCLAGRLDAVWRTQPVTQRDWSEPPSAALGDLYFDAVTYDARTLAAALDLARGKLLFGTDHPFAVADPERQLEAIGATVAPDLRGGIYSGTAQALFGLGERRTPPRRAGI